MGELYLLLKIVILICVSPSNYYSEKEIKFKEKKYHFNEIIIERHNYVVTRDVLIFVLVVICNKKKKIMCWRCIIPGDNLVLTYQNDVVLFYYLKYNVNLESYFLDNEYFNKW